jgi:hypothetical protein
LISISTFLDFRFGLSFFFICFIICLIRNLIALHNGLAKLGGKHQSHYSGVLRRPLFPARWLRPCKSILTNELNEFETCRLTGDSASNQRRERKGSYFFTEIRAGLATFFAMAYIISVNATIVSDTVSILLFGRAVKLVMICVTGRY